MASSSSSSCVTPKDRERDRSPSPVLPTLAQIRAHLKEKDAYFDKEVRLWVVGNLFPALSPPGNYFLVDGAVEFDCNFHVPADLSPDHVMPVVRSEIERKMPGFTVKKLKLKPEIRQLRLRLVETPDAAAISDDIEKKVASA